MKTLRLIVPRATLRLAGSSGSKNKVVDLFLPLKRFPNGGIIFSKNGALRLGRAQEENNHGDQHVTGADGRGEGEGGSSRESEEGGEGAEEGCERSREAGARGEEGCEAEQQRRDSSVRRDQDWSRVGDLGRSECQEGITGGSQGSDGCRSEGRDQPRNSCDSVRQVAQVLRPEGDARGSKACGLRRPDSASTVIADAQERRSAGEGINSKG